MEPHYVEYDDADDFEPLAEDDSDECPNCLGTGKWKCMSTGEWNACAQCGGTGIEGETGL